MTTLLSCKIGCTLYPRLHTENYQKKEPTYSDFREAVVILKLNTSINFDALYEEFCIIKPTLVLFLNEKCKQTLLVTNCVK